MASSFGRLANLWRGFVSLWVSDVEKNHPEIAYENAINGMIAKYAALKSATAGIIRRREDIEARHTEQAKELAQVSLDLNTAVETNQDDLALVLIQKKAALETSLGDLRAELATASADADSAKASLTQTQAEIKKLKAEKDAMLAKMHSAQARLRIQEQLDGLSVDNEVKALDNAREHIKNLTAEAKLGSELNDSSLDTRLAKLRQQSGDATSRSQLEQLKAAAAAKKSGQRTM